MTDLQETREIDQFHKYILDLYDNHRGAAYRIIGNVLGTQVSTQEREDLVQEGFCRMIRRWKSLSGLTQREYYLYMCATMRHLAVDEGRRRSKHKVISLEEISPWEEEGTYGEWGSYSDCCVSAEAQVLSVMERCERYRLLQQAMSRLNQRDRDVLTGYYCYECNDRVMAKWLGIKESSVRVYRSRALKKLAEKYREEMHGCIGEKQEPIKQ